MRNGSTAAATAAPRSEPEDPGRRRHRPATGREAGTGSGEGRSPPIGVPTSAGQHGREALVVEELRRPQAEVREPARLGGVAGLDPRQRRSAPSARGRSCRRGTRPGSSRPAANPVIEAALPRRRRRAARTERTTGTSTRPNPPGVVRGLYDVGTGAGWARAGTSGHAALSRDAASRAARGGPP